MNLLQNISKSDLRKTFVSKKRCVLKMFLKASYVCL